MNLKTTALAAMPFMECRFERVFPQDESFKLPAVKAGSQRSRIEERRTPDFKRPRCASSFRQVRSLQ
jgi:hypothetical protein